MLQTKYQGSRPGGFSGFRQEDLFHVYPIYALVKYETTLGGTMFGAMIHVAWLIEMCTKL